MAETFSHTEHTAIWHPAIRGETTPDWDKLFEDYVAAVDWPAVTFWRELADYYPDAAVLLSTRPTDDWWRSVSATIFPLNRREIPDDPFWGGHMRMVRDMFERFTPNWDDEASAKAAYEAHNAEVRATIPSERLTEWHPGDGWGPLCEMLGTAIPDTPFPHFNTTEDFRSIAGMGASEGGQP